MPKVIEWYLSWFTSGLEFCVVWLQKMLVSGLGSPWESSVFVPWFLSNAIRDVSREVPEWAWFNGFMRKSSKRVNAAEMRFSVLLNSCDNFLWLFLIFLRNLSDAVFLWFWNTRALYRVATSKFLTVFLAECCKLSFTHESCHFLREN